MIKYSEQWDAYYDDETNEWLESKCDDPTCEYCANRPDKATSYEHLLGEALDLAVPETWTKLSLEQLERVVEKFADLLKESIVADLEQFKKGYDDRAMFNLHEMVGHIQERIRGI